MAKIINKQANLLTKLIDLQKNEHYTDMQFARKLGVPRSTWQLARTQVTKIGRKLLSAVLRTFPELSADVLLLLKGNNNGDAKH